jgi:hypothetical protein
MTSVKAHRRGPEPAHGIAATMASAIAANSEKKTSSLNPAPLVKSS